MWRPRCCRLHADASNYSVNRTQTRCAGSRRLPQALAVNGQTSRQLSARSRYCPFVGHIAWRALRCAAFSRSVHRSRCASALRNTGCVGNAPILEHYGFGGCHFVGILAKCVEPRSRRVFVRLSVRNRAVILWSVGLLWPNLRTCGFPLTIRSTGRRPATRAAPVTSSVRVREK